MNDLICIHDKGEICEKLKHEKCYFPRQLDCWFYETWINGTIVTRHDIYEIQNKFGLD
jgi:hypothetical protein